MLSESGKGPRHSGMHPGHCLATAFLPPQLCTVNPTRSAGLRECNSARGQRDPSVHVTGGSVHTPGGVYTLSPNSYGKSVMYNWRGGAGFFVFV